MRISCYLISSVLLLFVFQIVGFSQKLGTSFTGGIGLYGQEKMNSLTPFVNVTFPVGSSLIIVEISKSSLPQKLENIPNLSVSTIEIDYNYLFEPGRAFMLIGGGLSYNIVNGGLNTDDKNWGPFMDKNCLGFGLNIGMGIYITRKFASSLEYVAKGVFASDEGEAYGGLRFGLKFYPWKDY